MNGRPPYESEMVNVYMVKKYITWNFLFKTYTKKYWNKLFFELYTNEPNIYIFEFNFKLEFKWLSIGRNALEMI